MANKIETLIKGQDKIAPRTKTRAVSDDNGVNLDTLLSQKQSNLTHLMLVLVYLLLVQEVML